MAYQLMPHGAPTIVDYFLCHCDKKVASPALCWLKLGAGYSGAMVTLVTDSQESLEEAGAEYLATTSCRS